MSDEIEGLDSFGNSRNRTPMFEAHKNKSSGKRSSDDQHFKQLSSIKNDDELSTDDQELVKKIQSLYSQFFSNEQKQAQDRIRNKNQVFKSLYTIATNDLGRLREKHKQIKKDNKDLSKISKEF